MSDLYRLKPLEWRRHEPHRDDPDGREWWAADTVFGSMKVEWEQYNGWRWSYCFDEYYDEDNHACGSPEDGKAQAEAFYRDRVLLALEPVPAPPPS